jgi:hypothetical protein
MPGRLVGEEGIEPTNLTDVNNAVHKRTADDMAGVSRRLCGLRSVLAV